MTQHNGLRVSTNSLNTRALWKHKVSLASFHLEWEVNQWWQWLRRAYHEERKEVTWDIFVKELWSRFGPTDCEDFDESL